jgi:hypothetical protein
VLKVLRVEQILVLRVRRVGCGPTCLNPHPIRTLALQLALQMHTVAKLQARILVLVRAHILALLLLEAWLRRLVELLALLLVQQVAHLAAAAAPAALPPPDPEAGAAFVAADMLYLLVPAAATVVLLPSSARH